MKMSLILPCYNVEKYLNKCIDSILQQDFTDYEIILVDDGATDRSGKICDQYAQRNDSIHVIHKENGGLSDARNAGLKVASGEYILFIDSDDYIAKGALSKIDKCLKEQNCEIDVMFLDGTKFYPDGSEQPIGDGYDAKRINGMPKDEVMFYLATLPKYPASAYLKCLRREFIIANELYFVKGLLSEDIEWTVRVFKAARVFAYCDYPYYFYRQSRPGSITNTVNKKNLNHVLSTIYKWSSRDLTMPYQREINSFMAYEYLVVMINYVGLNQSDKKEIYKKLKDLRWVLDYHFTNKEKLGFILTRTFGIHLSSYLLKSTHIISIQMSKTHRS